MTSTSDSVDADAPITSLAICSICLDLFEGDPRMLPCGHTNCTRCLVQLRPADQTGLTFKCPQCQRVFAYPVTQFPVNFVAKQLVELLKKRESMHSKETSDNDNPDQLMTAPNGAGDDVWTLEEGALYRWKDWRLVRTWDSLFIWCDAIVLELRYSSNGYIDFFLNGRLGILYSNDRPKYYFDTADNRAKFIGKLHKAKAAVPSGAQPKSIFSVPHASLTIEFGNWELASVKSGTIFVTHRKNTEDHKLIIREDFVDHVMRILRC